MKENRMAVMPVRKLMISMGIPMIISMALQALYNIVDSAFVSNMPEGGEAALNALTLAFPMQMLMVAVGVGTGVGVNALIAKYLGAGKKEEAGRAAGVSLVLCALITGVFMLFSVFGVKAFVNMQTENAIVASMAEEYLRLCTLFSAGIIFFSVLEKFLQASGLSVYSTIGQVFGAHVNIVLDPVLIYGLFGLRAMGVTGAAAATIIGQFSGALLLLYFHIRKNRDVKVLKEDLCLDKKMVKDIYAIGLPAIIAQALMSIMTFVLNIILVSISENIQTAYGLYYKIQQFVLFCAFGMRDAITPITSFAKGMGDKQRVRESIRCGLLYTSVIMLTGMILVEILAVPFAGVFGLSGQTESLCISAMRIVSLSFLFAGGNIASQGVFQALDGGREVMVIAFGRQLVFILPTAWLFSKAILSGRLPVSSFWWTFFIGEGITFLIAFLLLKKKEKTELE